MEAARKKEVARETCAAISELTLLIAERANRLALERRPGPGRELELWLEAEAEVKRERGAKQRAAGD